MMSVEFINKHLVIHVFPLFFPFLNCFDGDKVWIVSWVATVTYQHWSYNISLFLDEGKGLSFYSDPHKKCIMCVCVCVCVCALSCVWLVATPWTTRLLCPWDFPGKNPGVGCHFLLQGNFLTQGFNLCLLLWQADFVSLCHLESSMYYVKSESESCTVVSNSLRPHGLYCLWNSPGQNTGVGSCSLLKGIFPTQGSNPGLLHCRQILYQLSHKGRQIYVYDISAYYVNICIM